jgi:hypothetical protein
LKELEQVGGRRVDEANPHGYDPVRLEPLAMRIEHVLAQLAPNGELRSMEPAVG